MKKDNLKNMLSSLESKLDTLLQTSETHCPYTLYAWLNEWYITYKANKLTAKSLGILRNSIDHIKSGIQDLPLDRITVFDLQKALDGVKTTCTRENAYSVLKHAYKQATALNYILINPMDNIPRPIHKRKKGVALTLEQQTAFINSLDGNPIRNYYIFLLLSGCRCSEGLSLTWGNIDMHRDQLHIQGTKTNKADRYIPLFPQISLLLQAIPKDGERLFPYSYQVIKRNLYKLKKQHSFTFRLHDLRHTFATRCLESGINLLTVSKWLGHASPSITANIYMHILTEFERTEAEKFNPHI